MSDGMSALAFLVALAAFVLAYRAHSFAKRAHDTVAAVFHVMESRTSRTVTVDHTDGRVTIVKEYKDAT